MIETSALDDLLASPAGRYLAGPAWVSFIADPALVGVVVWGRPTGEQILELLHRHERMRPVLAPRVAALVDVRHLELPDPSAYAAVVGFLADRREWLAEYMGRLALVRAPTGLVGAAGAGFFDVSPKPFVVGTFEDLRGALEWIGRSDAAALEEELEAIFVEASGAAPQLRKLRAFLEARPGAVSLGEAARALAVSDRSLQRSLRSWNTTFQAEAGRAQVQVAQRLLASSDAPLAQIAIDVGCASLSHFSALFRRMTGETASEWRKRRRG